ncbi:Semaphorin-6B Semaphorin-Z [Takifugu flavidus]|uniref:Semaphorin-6B Semaphorin-Z n=1 Tax=Takifugu flavidus TaxID=433684 RepID=A0A5C6MUL5_9TELE|nr:Semaphorin-6B Semaphorin-Z [Takifugu flavidus]
MFLPKGLPPQTVIDEPDGLVSVNLLVVSAVSAFATGAVLSGLTVCWIMSHRHRHSRGSASNGARRKSDKEHGMLGQGCSGSVMSVTRTSGGERRRSQADNPFVTPNGWPKGEMDPGLLPTPEQTPLQQKRTMRLPDGDWDQSQTFLTAVGTPCPNNSVIYLSSKFLHGGGGNGGMVRIEDPGEVILPPHTERQRYLILATQRGEHGGGRPSGALRNSAGEYIYPATPQDSPDRRRVVSAPTPHMDYGEPRWSHEALNYNSNNGAPYHLQRHGLIRPDVHGPRALGELADFSHLLVKNMGERAPSGQ